MSRDNSAFKRILFLGTTGVGKQHSVARLTQWYDDQASTKWTTVDFESEFLYKAVALDRFSQTRFEDIPAQELRSFFLDATQDKQRQLWELAWNEFHGKLKSNTADGLAQKHIFLCIHGCYTRSHYGVRSVLDTHAVANDFKPDLVFTLIDDVYNAWWTTRKRAQEDLSRNEPHVGKPTLEHLIYARRVELLIGDQVVHACIRQRRHVKNVMLSVSHPVETFTHCINHPTAFKVAYLSFPISMPREAQAEGVNKLMEDTSAFVREAYGMQTRNPKLVIQCPLAIDELPLITALKEMTRTDSEATTFLFDRDALRWPLDSLWNAEDRLGTTPIMGGNISIKEIQNAAGSIWADVSFRDYRLVDQADFLLVFNPIYRMDGVSTLKGRDKVAGSVDKEIQYAKSHSKPVYIYQDPEYDPFQVVDSKFDARLETPADRATMDDHPWDRLTIRKATQKQLLDVLQQVPKRGHQV